MGPRALFACCALAWTGGCVVENPAWYADAEGSSGARGSSGDADTSSAEAGSETATASMSASSSASDALTTTNSTDASTTGGETDGDGFSCAGIATAVPLPVGTEWTDFDVNARGSDIIVSVVDSERLQVFAVQPSGATRLLEEPFGGQSVLGNLRDEELVLALGDSGGAPATVLRANLDSSSVETLGSFAIPVFPVRGLLRGAAGRFSILTRTQAGVDSPAYLTRLDTSQVPLTQADDDVLQFGNTTWFVGAQDEDGRGWLVLRRKPSDACIVLEVLSDGSVGESWEFADECYDPDITPFGDGAAVSYHRAESDRNVFVRTFLPGQPPSIELGLGTGGPDESSAHIVARGGSALVLWSVDAASLGGAVVQLDSGGIERLPSDLAPLSSAGGNMWAFGTTDGTAGAVHPDDGGALQATFLCGPP